MYNAVLACCVNNVGIVLFYTLTITIVLIVLLFYYNYWFFYLYFVISPVTGYSDLLELNKLQ